MKTFTQITEAGLNLSPEQKKRRAALKQKRKEWMAKGKDVSAIDAELAALEGGGPVPSPAATGPTKKPASAGKDWDEGYKAALEAIKQAQSGNMQGQGQGSGQNDSGLEGIPMDPSQMQGQGQGSGQGSENDKFQGAASQSGGSGGSGQSRNGKQEGQGVVRPEDCIGPDDLNGTPGTAGGMISKDAGDKISEAEGYDKEGGNEESAAKEWGERAKRAASQMAGKGEGYERLRSTLDGLYKATKDWKKELKKIVGYSISPDDKRSAYANKNILISQDRIARTDKDKYNCTDYMVVAIDTSGSMTEEYLHQCLCEVYQIALAKKPLKLVIIQFDTRIADIQEFTNLNDLKKKMHHYELKGGGGTECKPVFDLLAKDRKYSRRPAELLMIFTDGYLTTYPRNMRTMKNLIWVVIDNLSFEPAKKDAHTKVIRINSADIYGK